MIKTYKELIDMASFKGPIEFEEKKAVRAYSDGQESALPMVTILLMPDKYIVTLMSSAFLKYSKMFSGIIDYGECENLPDVEGKQFYAYAFLHGYDYGHHGEPCITGLLLDAGYVDERCRQEIDPQSELYKFLQGIENMEAPLSHERTPFAQNRKMKLEEKVQKLIVLS